LARRLTVLSRASWDGGPTEGPGTVGGARY
jgi:hypothetical protein